jgi:DNA-binding response OmpR family regulator
VLVVDDDPADRLLVATMMRDMGFEVVEVDHAEGGRRVLSETTQEFSLVILDLFLPGEHGGELLRTIRQSLATQSLPVVVLTSSANPKDELDLLEAGADDYILKPVAVDRLEARVRAVLRRSGVRIAGGVGFH